MSASESSNQCFNNSQESASITSTTQSPPAGVESNPHKSSGEKSPLEETKKGLEMESASKYHGKKSRSQSNKHEDINNNRFTEEQKDSTKEKATKSQEQELLYEAQIQESENFAQLLQHYQFPQQVLDNAAFKVITKGARFQTLRENFEELLINGACKDAKIPASERTLLMTAVETGHEPIVNVLVEVIADPFLVDKQDNNVLHLLLTSSPIEQSRHNILKSILEKEEINRRPGFDKFLNQKRQIPPQLPLTLAISKRDQQFACMLLDAGCNINFNSVETETGNTILHQSVEYDFKLVILKIMGRLNLGLSKHLDFLYKKNKNKKSAINLAEERGKDDLVKILIPHKKREQTPNNNWTSSSPSLESQQQRGKREKGNKKGGTASTSYQLKHTREDEEPNKDKQGSTKEVEEDKGVDETKEEFHVKDTKHQPIASPILKPQGSGGYKQQTFVQKQMKQTKNRQTELNQIPPFQQQELSQMARNHEKHKPSENKDQRSNLSQFAMNQPREEAKPMNNHYQSPQFGGYNRHRSNTNGSEGGGWNQQSYQGGGNYQRQQNDYHKQQNDYHKQQKKKTKQMGGPNNNNLNKTMNQTYQRSGGGVYNEMGTGPNNRGQQNYHRGPSDMMMDNTLGAPSQSQQNYSGQRYQHQNHQGRHQHHTKTNLALSFPPPPIVDESTGVPPQPSFLPQYTSHQMPNMMPYPSNIPPYYSQQGAPQMHTETEYTSSQSLRMSTDSQTSSPSLSGSSGGPLHQPAQLQMILNTGMYLPPQQNTYLMPSAAFSVPNTVISSKQGAPGGQPSSANNSSTAPQMSMNLMPDGQQKIKEDYERHQIEYNNKLLEENKKLQRQVDELAAERKILHKDIAAHRLQIKNQERTIQQLSDMLDQMSRHNTLGYLPPHMPEEGHQEVVKAKREDNNNMSGSEGSSPTSTYQRSLYDLCESKNKTLQEFGSHKNFIKELKEVVGILTQEIEEFSDEVSRRVQEHRPTKERVIERAKKLIVMAIPNADVQVYGSHATELCLPWSDIDLVINLPSGHADVYSSTTQLQQVEKRMKESSDFIEDCTLVRAAIPVLKLKCQDQEFGNFQVDITIQDSRHNGLRCVSLVKTFLTKYSHLKPLVLVLKELIKNSGHNNPFHGGLSSYALTLMVVRHIEIRPSGSLGEMILSFLFDYGFQFNSDAETIEVRLPTEYCARDKGTLDDRGFSPLSFNNHGGRSPIIIDPLSSQNNVSKSAYNFYYIQKVFTRAYYSALEQIQQRLILNLQASQPESTSSQHPAVTKALSMQSLQKLNAARAQRSILESLVTCASDLLDTEERYKVLMYSTVPESFEFQSGMNYLPAAVGFGGLNNSQNFPGGEFYLAGFPPNFPMMTDVAYNNQNSYSMNYMGDGSETPMNISTQDGSYS